MLPLLPKVVTSFNYSKSHGPGIAHCCTLVPYKSNYVLDSIVARVQVRLSVAWLAAGSMPVLYCIGGFTCSLACVQAITRHGCGCDRRRIQARWGWLSQVPFSETWNDSSKIIQIWFESSRFWRKRTHTHSKFII